MSKHALRVARALDGRTRLNPSAGGILFWDLVRAGGLGLASALSVAAASGLTSLPQAGAELFTPTKVWTAHFLFTPEQWEAMEPKGGRGLPFGGPGGLRGRGGPGGPGGFGPGTFLAPAFLQQGDRDRDTRLTKDEFTALGAKWFAEWDQEKSGRVSADQLREGLNRSLGPPNFGPPGGGPGRGPGGPGGRGPGLNLQGAEGKRNGLASAMGIEFDYVHADLEFEGQMIRDVAVRYKGNGTFLQSRGSLKRSLKVSLTRFAKGRNLAGVVTLNFHNNVTDASWMNEVLSHRLFRDAGVPAPRTAFARLFVTVPGKYDREYVGLYSLVENVDTYFARERFGTKKGAIFKPVTPEVFADLGGDWAKYNQTYDPKTAVGELEASRVIEFARLVTHAGDAEFAAKLGEYLDLDEFARFMAVTVWLSTMDSILGPGQNYYLYLHPATHQFQFIPWDLDHSFGQFPLIGSQTQRENLSLDRPWQGDKRFLERVFNAPAFKQLYLARLAEFSKTIFRPERIHQLVDEIAAAIRPAVQQESEFKLARFDRVVAGEPVEPAGFGEPRGEPRPNRAEGGEGPRFGRPGGPGGFMQPVKPIKGFVTARAPSVLAQLAGQSKGQTLAPFGFGPGGPGDPGGPGRPGRPGGFGPGAFVGRAFLSAMDTNQDEVITREEFSQGFAKWFDTWSTDKNGALTEEQLRAGLNRDLSPFRGGPP